MALTTICCVSWAVWSLYLANVSSNFTSLNIWVIVLHRLSLRFYKLQKLLNSELAENQTNMWNHHLVSNKLNTHVRQILMSYRTWIPTYTHPNSNSSPLKMDGNGRLLEDRKKPGLTFHYTGWLIGILISWFIIVPI